MLDMVSYIKLVRRTVFDIRLQKWRDLENRFKGRLREGHWKCHHSIKPIYIWLPILMFY